MKGISPLIGAIVLISITFTLAAMMYPWLSRLAEDSTNQTGQTTNKEIYCRDMSYDFVTSYGTNGIDWNFSGGSDYLRVQVKNYGNVDVYDFSFDLELSDFSLVRFDTTNTSQKPKVNALKPGDSAIIEADITQDLTQNLNKVIVRNGMDCTPLSQEM
jgi:flagellin-like protein